MKKALSILLLGAATQLVAHAQSAIDAYNVSQSDMRGTARFMSMAGAFGALGGDLSTLTQNPAGIGVYRTSDIGVTVDFDFLSGSTQNGYNFNQTKVACNNFGYVGALNLSGEVLVNFNWGATYSRKVSFERAFGGKFNSLPTSLTNVIAPWVDGYYPSELNMYGDYNPYYGIPGVGNPDWLGVLAFNSGMINTLSPNSSSYYGLFQNGTSGFGEYEVIEKGHIDEYSLNFGGNIADILYWGIGFGITDLKYKSEFYYGEGLYDARIPDFEGTGVIPGDASYGLTNYKEVSGSGFNMKFGVILKPINEFRVGIAVHTPTWYSLNYGGQASTDYWYSSGFAGYYNDGYEETDWDSFSYRMRSPWRLILSAAGVIGGRFIISADYERDAYNNMTFSSSGWDYYDYSEENNDIKTLFQASNTIRLGAEFRITPKFSVRAGYSYTGDNVKTNVLSGEQYVYTSGMNPAYVFNKTTQYITCGLGYRFGQFYVDAAYAYRNRQSQYTPFSIPEYIAASPLTAKVKQYDNNLVLTLGYKF